MNATNTGMEGVKFDYKAAIRQSTTRRAPEQRSNSHAAGRKRRGKGPQMFNGIHRRRRKSITW